jgi:biotin transporter BioY
MFKKIPTKRELAQFALHELLKQGAGFLAGLIAYEWVSSYFRVKKWFQFWGFLSKKKALDGDVFNIAIFVISFLIGLVALYIVNQLITIIFSSKDKPENT